jgi:hypothetical protein
MLVLSPLRRMALVALCMLFALKAAALAQQSGNIALNKPAQQSSTSPWSNPNDAKGAVETPSLIGGSDLDAKKNVKLFQVRR